MKKMTKKEIEDFVLIHNIRIENNLWIGERTCKTCFQIVIHSTTERFFTIRNIKKSTNKSCLSCSMTGDKNSFFGKTHSKETKKQVSKSRIGKACGQDNAMSNIRNREKVSVGLKEKYKSGDLDYLRKIQSDFAKKHHSDGTFKTYPVSKIELDIKERLSAANINFESQFKINSKPYDFYFPEKNLLVEFNGDYFHANPNKYNANYFNKKKKMFANQLWEQDETKKKEALDNGYDFLTIWEQDYKKDKNLEINKLINYGK